MALLWVRAGTCFSPHPHGRISWNQRPTQEVPLNPHRLAIKVYLEDTDAQGIVYHASYVRFFERGRTEYLEALGSAVGVQGSLEPRLVVHELRLKYHKPARFGDRLAVISTARLASPYRVTFVQRIERSGAPGVLCQGTVEVACTDPAGRLVPIPDVLVRLLG
jgi:tol-pal system-associated acyl-CoA thioesterase